MTCRECQRLTLISSTWQRIEQVDEVVTLSGFRPDLTWLSEIRLELDPTLQTPVELAPLIDPNIHSCGTVYPHGAAELSHPEKDFYLAGMKSYGRAPTFLAMTGYEQVRSIAAQPAGDHEAAARVEPRLAETGRLRRCRFVRRTGRCTGRRYLLRGSGTPDPVRAVGHSPLTAARNHRTNATSLSSGR